MRKERKRQEAQRRRELQPLKNQLKKLELQLAEYQAKQQSLESLLADNDLYREDRKEELKRHLAEKTEVDRQLQRMEESWLDISEKLEAAQTAETY